jgi:hypothetical protein
MLETKLTEREQRGLEHLRRAEEQKMSVAQYARSAGVVASEIYNAKQSLVRKGVIPGRLSDGHAVEDKSTEGPFVPVHILSNPFRSASASGCQIRYPSGVTIECPELPPTGWIIALVGGVRDVVA